MDLGFIGTGTITAAVVTGLAKADHKITVSQRNAAQAKHLAESFACVTVAENQTVLDRSEIIFLGLVAHQAAQALAGLRFRAGQQVISFIADLTLETVAALVAPAKAVAIMLPFPAIAQGGSPILALGDTTVIETLFGHSNTVFSVQNRAELDAYLCAQAVLSPTILMVASAADWVGRQGPDRDTAEAFLRALVASNLQTGRCQDRLAALATPGGYNLKLRQSLEKAGLVDALTQGMDSLKL